MDAAVAGALIGLGIMVLVGVTTAVYDRTQGRCCHRPHGPTQHTPLLSSRPSQQDLQTVLQRQQSHFKIATVIPQANTTTITITRQNGSRTFQTLETPVKN
jgi:hypothetical protein